MKLSSALLWLTSSVLGVRPSYGEPKYFEVGKTLTLEPDLSTVKQPVSSIRWKYGSSLVVDWEPSGFVYYGLFKGRTTLDPQTLRLDINPLTLADSGQFSLETGLGTVMTQEVKVIKPPPKPSLNLTTPTCEVTCTLECTAVTKDLGPGITYEWKKYEEKEHKLIAGPWTEGDVLKSMNGSETCEEFSCRLVTLLGPSDASGLMGNPLCPDDHTWWKVLLGITVTLGAVGAVLTTMVYKCPDHPFSKCLKSSIPWIKKADSASEGPNDKMDAAGGHV